MNELIVAGVALMRHPATLRELGLVFVAMATAWLIGRFLRPRPGQTFIRRSLATLAFPLAGIVLVGVLRGVSLLQGWPQHFTLTAIKLLWAMIGLRMVTFALQRTFPEAGWIRAFGRGIAAFVWCVIALDLFGWLPDLIAWLNAFVLPMGRKSVTLWDLMQGTASVAGALLVALWAGGLIEERLMLARELDSNLRVVISRLVQALLILVAILIGAELVGLDITALSVFGGALGVGLGLGMQKIASSYVSGFILLLDRSIKIGNLIQVGAERGEVLNITTRYTVLRSLTGTHFIVPNDTLVSSTVQNDSYVSPTTRVAVRVQVAYDTDVEAVLAMLTEIGRAQPRVLDDPAPAAYLVSFDDSGITLELGVWIPDPEGGTLGLKSDMNREILRRFNAAGIAIPFPQRELRILGHEGTAPAAPAA